MHFLLLIPIAFYFYGFYWGFKNTPFGDPSDSVGEKLIIAFFSGIWWTGFGALVLGAVALIIRAGYFAFTGT